MTVVNCSTSSLSISSTSIPSGSLWVNLNAINHFSVRGDNRLTLTVTGSAPSYYSVGSGSTLISLSINNQGFTITNSNTTFAAGTTFTIT